MLPFLILDFFQIVAFAAVLLRFRQRTPVDSYLTLIMLGGALAMLSKIVLFLRAPNPDFVLTISSTLSFCAMSHLFIYEVITEKPVKKWLFGLFISPFVLSVFLFIIALIHINNPVEIAWWRLFGRDIRLSSLIVHLFLDLFIIVKYRSSAHKWLKNINGGIIIYFVIHKMLLIGIMTLPPHLVPIENMTVYIGLLSMPALLAITVYYKVLLNSYRKSKELEKTIANFVQNTEAKSTNKKYVKSNPNDTRYKVLADKMQTYLTHDKPYLDMDFSAANLADTFEITQHDLSLILNHHLNCSFYEYINTFRIQYYIENIYRVKNGELTILTLAYEAGFSAKSTFNKYFKQVTGFSPTVYLDHAHASDASVSL